MRASLTAVIHGDTYDDIVRRTRQVVAEFFSIDDEAEVSKLINNSECELQVALVSPVTDEQPHAFTAQLYVRLRPLQQ